MNTLFRICIGATIAIFAGLLIAAAVFHVDIMRGLGVVGFFFVVGLPLYIGHRIDRNRHEDETMTAISESRDRCRQALDEAEECLDDSIENFRKWGWWIRELERTDERWFYTLCERADMDGRRLSAVYGKDVTDLIKTRRKLFSVRYYT